VFFLGCSLVMHIVAKIIRVPFVNRFSENFEWLNCFMDWKVYGVYGLIFASYFGRMKIIFCVIAFIDPVKILHNNLPKTFIIIRRHIIW